MSNGRHRLEESLNCTEPCALGSARRMIRAYLRAHVPTNHEAVTL